MKKCCLYIYIYIYICVRVEESSGSKDHIGYGSEM